MQSVFVNDIKDFANVLANIHPKSSNKKEWAGIRALSAGIHAQVTYGNCADEVKDLLTGFATCHPLHDNKVEWKQIRAKCADLLQHPDLFYQFYGIVTQFSVTSPTRDNRVEWKQIRSTCSTILSHTPANDVRKFAQVLSETDPKKDDIPEWTTIHGVSRVVANNVNDVNFARYIRKLIYLFGNFYLVVREKPSKNKIEWDAIKSTCGIMGNYNSNPFRQFYEMVGAFFVTSPKCDNRVEWGNIRSVCKDILSRKPSDVILEYSSARYAKL